VTDIIYGSDSQPGVRVPPGVRTSTFRGRRKKLNNGGKRQIRQQFKIRYNSNYIIANILLILRVQFMEIGCQGAGK
jgi:hypothetical protein